MNIRQIFVISMITVATSVLNYQTQASDTVKSESADLVKQSNKQNSMSQTTTLLSKVKQTLKTAAIWTFAVGLGAIGCYFAILAKRSSIGLTFAADSVICDEYKHNSSLSYEEQMTAVQAFASCLNDKVTNNCGEEAQDLTECLLSKFLKDAADALVLVVAQGKTTNEKNEQLQTKVNEEIDNYKTILNDELNKETQAPK